MFAIVKFFWVCVSLFCLTIWPVYAEESQRLDLMMPALVIDLSTIAASIFQQQAKVWLFLLSLAGFLCFLLYIVLNRQVKQAAFNQGDLLAKRASLLWMMCLLMLIVGCALPMLRVLMV